ncbi:hypothetical protein EDD16DRAFT_1503069 [Pisolithus croceorrhizus]|nr:hypothetical protein EDD16DRAFT_1503069 [Pisolithus croceorrhizus]KAI6096685.1 hypothetical protein EV401DRAFT_1880105 [Pisolithus croceorrhizus]KAI6169891.1 hypothetical protein EDD17DRAFT_1463638 [Pisolithus thermaeus]
MRIIKQQQFPITSAYALTDYRLQGQTIPYTIVDIAKPPTSVLTLFNLYVALLRKLLTEDDHLVLLDNEMASWWSCISGSE